MDTLKIVGLLVLIGSAVVYWGWMIRRIVRDARANRAEEQRLGLGHSAWRLRDSLESLAYLVIVVGVGFSVIYGVVRFVKWAWYN